MLRFQQSFRTIILQFYCNFLFYIWISVSQHTDNVDGAQQCTSSGKERDIVQLGDTGRLQGIEVQEETGKGVGTGLLGDVQVVEDIGLLEDIQVLEQEDTL